MPPRLERVIRTVVVRSIFAVLFAVIPGAPIAAQGGSRDTVTLARHEPVSGRRRYVLPAIEILSFQALLNAYDRVAYAGVKVDGADVFNTTPKTIWDHLRKQHWVQDKDPFSVNQIGHPYQGSMMYGFARSSGYGFWTSLIHADVGSFLWEMAGERGPPSMNDLITTGHAGSLLGEALYRMADLIIKDDGRTVPGRAREYGAMLVSPPGGLNRRLFKDRFRARLPDTEPATSWQLRFGATADALARDITAPRTILRGDATADFNIAYGLPGKPGYEYTRPLDYFDFQFSVLFNEKNPIESVTIRGLLKGGKTADRPNSRGIWGLYGSYDYFSPYLFRVSSTALSAGTTRQFNINPGLALQGTALAGVGYGAAGSLGVVPSTETTPEVRDYHAGVTPQGLLALRLIKGDRAMFDVTAREYQVRGYGSDAAQGTETIFRGSFGLTYRVVGGHAVAARYVLSDRRSEYSNQPDREMSEGTITLLYSLLGGNGFNAVKWQ